MAIGSAIASKKEIMVFDEPTSGLDYRHMLEVSNCLKKLSAIGKTSLIITHDPELIAECCDYFIFIEDGTVKWYGPFVHRTDSMFNNFSVLRKEGLYEAERR